MLQQRQKGAPDPFGAPAVTWVNVDQIWCDIEPASLTSARGAQIEVLDGEQRIVDRVFITMHAYPGVVDAIDWRIAWPDPGSAGGGTTRYYRLESLRTQDAQGVQTFVGFVDSTTMIE